MTYEAITKILNEQIFKRSDIFDSQIDADVLKMHCFVEHIIHILFVIKIYGNPEMLESKSEFVSNILDGLTFSKKIQILKKAGVIEKSTHGLLNDFNQYRNSHAHVKIDVQVLLKDELNTKYITPITKDIIKAMILCIDPVYIKNAAQIAALEKYIKEPT